MQKILISILFLLCLAFQSNASEVVLSNTGNAQLDGIYKKFVEVNGTMSFIKTTASSNIKIARFKLESTNSEVFIFGWMIFDSNGKEFFAVTDESILPPAQGWDVARAGVGLNVNFEITVRDEMNAKSPSFLIANTPSMLVKLFPNPTVGEIMVEADSPIQSLTLMNASGQTLLTTQNNRLDLLDLPNGVYSLIIETNGLKTTKKVIKQ
jgi:hypothetical protein